MMMMATCKHSRASFKWIWGGAACREPCKNAQTTAAKQNGVQLVLSPPATLCMANKTNAFSPQTMHGFGTVSK